jgi:hypothetical protein
VRQVVRKALVSGIQGIDDSALMTALEAEGLPKVDEPYLAYPILVVTDRDVQMVDNDKAEIVITYDHIVNEGQNMTTPPVGLVCGRMRTSVSQKTTNMYPTWNSDGSATWADILVSHTYPADDENYPGETKEQTGEITVMMPERTLSVEGIVETKYPWLIANKITGSVNKEPWSLQLPHYWMCTECGWEYLTGTRSRMSFEFQYNSDSWDYTAVFIDATTDRPPKGLVAGVGYKTIKYHRAVDFDELIGTKLQGG